MYIYIHMFSPVKPYETRCSPTKDDLKMPISNGEIRPNLRQSDSMLIPCFY